MQCTSIKNPYWYICHKVIYKHQHYASVFSSVSSDELAAMSLAFLFLFATMYVLGCNGKNPHKPEYENSFLNYSKKQSKRNKHWIYLPLDNLALLYIALAISHAIMAKRQSSVQTAKWTQSFLFRLRVERRIKKDHSTYWSCLTKIFLVCHIF